MFPPKKIMRTQRFLCLTSPFVPWRTQPSSRAVCLKYRSPTHLLRERSGSIVTVAPHKDRTVLFPGLHQNHIQTWWFLPGFTLLRLFWGCYIQKNHWIIVHHWHSHSPIFWIISNIITKHFRLMQYYNLTRLLFFLRRGLCWRRRRRRRLLLLLLLLLSLSLT